MNTYCDDVKVMTELSVRKHLSGVVIEYNDDIIAFDTGLASEPTLLSHAHADHITGIDRAVCVYSLASTFETIEARTNLKIKTREVVEYNTPFSIRNVKVQAFNAGHVIGSAMFLLEFSDGMTLLYTGDFNVVDSIVHEAAKPVSADVLIMETTYGTTEWVFPPRYETHDNILRAADEEWDSGKIPLFNVYSLGKAQETIKLLHDAGFNVISGNHTIDAVSDIYGRYGTLLTSSPISFDGLAPLLENKCAVVSSSPKYTKQSLRKNIGRTKSKEIEARFEEYSLSGWTLGKYSVRGYPLSAHSDFPGLASFVNSVKPRMVYCFTDNANTFSGYLMGNGINAVPLE